MGANFLKSRETRKECNQMVRSERRELKRKYLFFAQCPDCAKIYEIEPAESEFWAQKGFKIIVFSRKEISKNIHQFNSIQNDAILKEVCHA